MAAPDGLYGRQLARALDRARPLLETEEEVRGAALAPGASAGAEDGEWRLASLRAPWVVRDAPPSDPPDPSEFAVRAHAVCADVSYRATR